MNKERLKNGLEKMGIAADETALDRFEVFHAILDEYNARMDLTAVLDEDERVDRHDLDSAAPLAHGLLAPNAKVIDVGTGAGFPGMPLLILRPDLQMTFLDALNKRILFLQDALVRLGLKAVTLHARAEDAAKMAAHREQYDAAVSRAVANAATLEELTLPFVQKGGVAIAWKGPGVAEEMTAARRAAFLSLLRQNSSRTGIPEATILFAGMPWLTNSSRSFSCGMKYLSATISDTPGLHV